MAALGAGGGAVADVVAPEQGKGVLAQLLSARLLALCKSASPPAARRFLPPSHPRRCTYNHLGQYLGVFTPFRPPRRRPLPFAPGFKP